MKKLIITALVILSCGAAYALPVGNPAEANLLLHGVFFRDRCVNFWDPCNCWFDSWSLRGGYYGDFVFNRNLRIRGEGLGQGDVIEKTHIFTNAGYLALNIAEKCDVFGSLGQSSISILTNDVSWFLLGNELSTLKWQTFFSWSVGARATLFCWRCKWFLGIEGQYFQTNPRLTQFVNGTGVPTYFNTDNNMSHREWQGGIGISYWAKPFCADIGIVPYGAVKASWVRFKTNRFTFVETTSGDDFTLFNLKADKLWGYVIGATITFFDRIDITAEGQFASEKAIYINGQFRF
jgi:major outer membrane protein